VLTTAGSKYIAETHPPATKDAACLMISRARISDQHSNLSIFFELQMLNLQNAVPVNFAGNPALAITELLSAGRLVEARSRL
jgi:hypothetical protein